MRHSWWPRLRVHMTGVLLLMCFLVSPTAMVESAGDGLSVPDIVRQCGPAVVMILKQQDQSTSGIGSGFIVDSTGIIVTNFHVVKNATSLYVRLTSGEVYRVVSIVNLNKDRDLCLLQIEGFDLPYLNLGNSNEVSVGENCIAIGNPQGFENTVSTGIISGRRLYEGMTLLQTTAPVSPGSSGGPLLNQRGEAIGVTSLTWAEEGSQNINFAIPINYVRGMLRPHATFSFADLGDSESVKDVPGADELDEVKKQMPEGVVFWYCSGTLPPDYVSGLVYEGIRKHRVGVTEPAPLIARYVELMRKRYPDMGTVEFARKCAEDSRGYLLSVEISVSYGQLEDSVRAILYDPQTYRIIAEETASTVFGTTVEGTAKSLVNTCLKKLADTLAGRQKSWNPVVRTLASRALLEKRPA